METWRDRVNWPFFAILVLAVLAVLGRVVLVQHYSVPRLLRHHLADFCFAGFFTFVVTTILAPLRRQKQRQAEPRRTLWLSIPVIGTAIGLWVEFEDYLGLDDEEGGFDPGVILEWLGAPNTDTFDPMDLVAIFAGGVLVFILQRKSTKHIHQWRRFPLLLRTPNIALQR